MAVVFGRRRSTVERWGNGSLALPRDVARKLLERASDPRGSDAMREWLIVAMERELAYRLSGREYARRWLSLIVAGQASFAPASGKPGRPPLKRPSLPG